MKTAVGYDGVEFTIGDRVELHPGCDLWMKGAKFGKVESIGAVTGTVRVRLDALPGVRFLSTSRVRRVQ